MLAVAWMERVAVGVGLRSGLVVFDSAQKHLQPPCPLPSMVISATQHQRAWIPKQDGQEVERGAIPCGKILHQLPWLCAIGIVWLRHVGSLQRRSRCWAWSRGRITAKGHRGYCAVKDVDQLCERAPADSIKTLSVQSAPEGLRPLSASQ